MKKKKSSRMSKQEKCCPKIWRSQLHSALALSILLGFLLVLSASIVIYVSFGDFFATGGVVAEEMKLGITPLGFNIALLVVIIFSGIIIIFSSREKKKKEKEKAKIKGGV